MEAINAVSSSNSCSYKIVNPSLLIFLMQTKVADSMQKGIDPFIQKNEMIYEEYKANQENMKTHLDDLKTLNDTLKNLNSQIETASDEKRESLMSQIKDLETKISTHQNELTFLQSQEEKIKNKSQMLWQSQISTRMANVQTATEEAALALGNYNKNINYNMR